ncbi:MAG TPA: lytic transglycosylase domain-containing protein [Rhodobacteraceae bacterium]|nr:lytic transglycosylase domain-containing protein [Paracoccaceae bacterium]
MKTGIIWLALAAPLAAQGVDINTLVFQGSNSIIDNYNARPVEEGSMRANLAELRYRILADPFPIPEVVNEGSYYQMAIRKAAEYDIPKQLFFNLVTAESNWDPVIVSPRGAIGLAQLMPGTAEELGVDPWDALENLDGGARYLSTQYRRFGTWELALAAYNAGPGTVSRYDGIPPYAETEEYVKKILEDVYIP